MEWDGQEGASGIGTRYDILAGQLGPGPWNPLTPYGVPVCLAPEVAGTATTLPVAGSRWLLVRAGLPTCGEGTYGESGLYPVGRLVLDAGSSCP